ncbi:DUF262 domain-containing protein [Agrococcus sediminis]|uniref:DUF262 domain-containing protein n=1 Tax=Agrococcus sediminis TaxID=2599924 RepID=UPI0013E3EDED|nr:DUF262 domain-containing protein [Agrococcus sediminis]
MTAALPDVLSTRDVRPHVAVWKVHELLRNANLRIPDYQRPYTWSARNVAELVDDIQRFTPSGHYRIGTVILHRHADERGDDILDVVDGQQRLTTLHLLAAVLRETGVDPSMRDVARLRLSPFGAERTAARAKENRAFLARLVQDWDVDALRAFSDAVFLQCEVVVVTLANLDEAFQMFDSQNARGRPLYPTDLLKAFHLREIGSGRSDIAMKREVVELWESIPAAHVNALFAEYLFKIRRWAAGRPVPREGFTAADIGMFKGIRERDGTNEENHWARSFVYAKNYIDDFRSENATLARFRMMKPIEYPHQIDQPILNGETFFRMVWHYYQQGVRLGLHAFNFDELPKELSPLWGAWRSSVSAPIDEQSEPGGDRSRYAYVRGLLDALLLYYHDRFGSQERDRFAGLAARFAVLPRASKFAVKRETINNHALDGGPEVAGVNLFREIREALSAREVLDRTVPEPKLYGADRSRRNPTDAEVIQRLWGLERGLQR